MELLSPGVRSGLGLGLRHKPLELLKVIVS